MKHGIKLIVEGENGSMDRDIDGFLSNKITKPEAIEEMKRLDKECPGKGWGEQAAQLEAEV